MGGITCATVAPPDWENSAESWCSKKEEQKVRRMSEESTKTTTTRSFDDHQKMMNGLLGDEPRGECGKSSRLSGRRDTTPKARPVGRTDGVGGRVGAAFIGIK